jgi:hypothetical protein
LIESQIDLLLYWVREREKIRVLKESGLPPPWTSDLIFREWKFCNVRREDDRVTRWIKSEIRDRFAGHEHLWFMLCAARMINWPDTLDVLMGSSLAKRYPNAWPDSPDFVPARMGDALEDLKLLNLKVFTGAYIVPAPTMSGQTKGRYVAEQVLGNLWCSEPLRKWFASPVGRTLERTHLMLTSYRGWGPFLAYQAVVDMRFTSLLSSAPDVGTWCACGPGTIRGLNRLAGRPLAAQPNRDQLLREVLELYPIVVRATRVSMDLSDVPNVLCEFDKYSRVKLCQGTPRARYSAVAVHALF